MNLPFLLPKFSESKISPQGKLNIEDLRKMGINLIVFTAPVLTVFFGLLANGVPFSKAWPVAILVLWGVLADYFKKLNNK